MSFEIQKTEAVLTPAIQEKVDAAIREYQTPTPAEFRATEVNEALVVAYRNAGTLKLTPEEVAKLTAPFPRSVMERKMGKFTYIPHIFISRRLTEVFGPGQWTMIRRTEKMMGNQIMAEWVMIIRGVYIGESWGAQDYHPNNPNQTYADVLEATRGECIRRIAGKYLDCGSDAWDPEVQRQVDIAAQRARLEATKTQECPNLRQGQPKDAPKPAGATKPPADPLKAAKARLWAICKPAMKPVKKGEEAVELTSFLWRMGIINDNQSISDFTLPEIEETINRIEIELGQQKENEQQP